MPFTHPRSHFSLSSLASAITFPKNCPEVPRVHLCVHVPCPLCSCVYVPRVYLFSRLFNCVCMCVCGTITQLSIGDGAISIHSTRVLCFTIQLSPKTSISCAQMTADQAAASPKKTSVLTIILRFMRELCRRV